jgi:hypothetical protein
MVSAVTFGLCEEAFDVRFQYRRKSSRCHREPRLWSNDHKSLLPGWNPLGQQDEEDASGPGDWWPFHLSLERDGRVS